MEVLVIGAGVVGLAMARAAARKGHAVVVAEAANAIGTGISSRNSEVIHGGMYYPTGTLRGRHCVRGRRMLYDFCATHGVPHRKCGKLVVATNAAELEKIQAIEKQGHINGVEGLEMLGANAAHALEPELFCIGALHSPETGIIDAHAYMLALRGDLEDLGEVPCLRGLDRRRRRVGGKEGVAQRGLVQQIQQVRHVSPAPGPAGGAQARDEPVGGDSSPCLVAFRVDAGHPVDDRTPNRLDEIEAFRIARRGDKARRSSVPE